MSDEAEGSVLEDKTDYTDEIVHQNREDMKHTDKALPSESAYHASHRSPPGARPPPPAPCLWSSVLSLVWDQRFRSPLGHRWQDRWFVRTARSRVEAGGPAPRSGHPPTLPCAETLSGAAASPGDQVLPWE